jgi:hypothetical protein
MQSAVDQKIARIEILSPDCMRNVHIRVSLQYFISVNIPFMFEKMYDDMKLYIREDGVYYVINRSDEYTVEAHILKHSQKQFSYLQSNKKRHTYTHLRASLIKTGGKFELDKTTGIFSNEEKVEIDTFGDLFFSKNLYVVSS